MKKITTRTIVSEILKEHPGAASILARHGMSCEGCEAAPFETLGEAAAAYGKDPREILGEIGAKQSIRSRKKKRAPGRKPQIGRKRK